MFTQTYQESKHSLEHFDVSSRSGLLSRIASSCAKKLKNFDCSLLLVINRRNTSWSSSTYVKTVEPRYWPSEVCILTSTLPGEEAAVELKDKDFFTKLGIWSFKEQILSYKEQILAQ